MFGGGLGRFWAQFWSDEVGVISLMNRSLKVGIENRRSDLKPLKIEKKSFSFFAIFLGAVKI